MYQRLRAMLPEEGGGVIVLVALSMAVLLSSMALAIDVGLLMTARSEAQRVADAAALAGASAFLDPAYDPVTKPSQAQAEAEKRVYDWAALNVVRNQAIDSAEVVPEVILSEAKVRVTVLRQDIPLWFSGLFGVKHWSVMARAAAEAAEAGAPSDCVKPFAIPDLWDEATEDTNENRIMDFGIQTNAGRGQNGGPNEVWAYNPDLGDSYDPSTAWGSYYRDYMEDAQGNVYDQDHGRRIPLHWGQPGQGGVSSWWGKWVVPGSGSSGTGVGIDAMRDAMVSCYKTDTVIGTSVETQNGISNVPVHESVQELIDQDRDAYWDDDSNGVAYPDGSDSPYLANPRLSPRFVTVAVVHPEDVGTGKTDMRLVNWATLFLEDPLREYPEARPAQEAPITARLVRWGEGHAPAPNSGSLIKVLRLVE